MSNRLSVLLVLASAALGACHDWTQYDPRLGTSTGTSTSTGTGTGSSGGAGGSGGAPVDCEVDDNVGGGGSGAIGACSPLIADDFSSSLGQWGDVKGDVKVANGALVLNLPTIAVDIAQTRSNVLFNFTDCRSFVKLSKAPDTTSKGLAILSLQASPTDYYTLLETNGRLEAKGQVTGKELSTPPPTIPYNPTDHRYLGIRKRGDTVCWQTSPDGKKWTTMAVSKKELPSSMLRIVLGAVTYDTIEAVPPGETQFDDVNIAP
ncbi:MAG: hypothetical protein ACMG6S_13555 [Byssovorax sp.]